MINNTAKVMSETPVLNETGRVQFRQCKVKLTKEAPVRYYITTPSDITMKLKRTKELIRIVRGE